MDNVKDGVLVVDEIYSCIQEYISNNKDEEFDPLKLADYLYLNNFRKVYKPGLIIVKDETYIVTPELEDKVHKLLNS